MVITNDKEHLQMLCNRRISASVKKPMQGFLLLARHPIKPKILIRFAANRYSFASSLYSEYFNHFDKHYESFLESVKFMPFHSRNEKYLHNYFKEIREPELRTDKVNSIFPPYFIKWYNFDGIGLESSNPELGEELKLFYDTHNINYLKGLQLEDF